MNLAIDLSRCLRVLFLLVREAVAMMTVGMPMTVMGHGVDGDWLMSVLRIR